MFYLLKLLSQKNVIVLIQLLISTGFMQDWFTSFNKLSQSLRDDSDPINTSVILNSQFCDFSVRLLNLFTSHS